MIGRVGRAGLLATVIAGCSTDRDRSGASAPPQLSAAARVYVDSALAVMEAHVLGGDTVDWVAFRASVYRDADGSEVPVDTYRAIRAGLKTLNPHSFLQIGDSLMERERARHPVPADDIGPSVESTRAAISPFSRRRQEREIHIVEEHRIGRIAVPSFGGRHTTAFADTLEGFVRELAAAGVCGWIVDLRGNGGGNMWPMLAGIGPLLGNSDLGQFHTARGLSGTWFYRDGTTGIRSRDGDEIDIARVSGDPFRVPGTPPVAVLFDRGTGSSGEATAIAFIGRENTRSFGVPSFGFTTANQGFRLPDGANMLLTVGVNADRSGHTYPTALIPDETVPLLPDGSVPSTAPDPDPQVDAALQWVVQQPGCRG